MTSYFWAIADVGGNIYSGTFSCDKIGAKCYHVTGGRICYQIELKESEKGEFDVIDSVWKPFADKGDHLVLCEVETSDNITVTQCI